MAPLTIAIFTRRIHRNFHETSPPSENSAPLRCHSKRWHGARAILDFPIVGRFCAYSLHECWESSILTHCYRLRHTDWCSVYGVVPSLALCLCLSLTHHSSHSVAFGVGVAPVSIQRCIFRHRKLCSFVDMECWSAVRALERGVDTGDACVGVHMLVPNTCPVR